MLQIRGAKPTIATVKNVESVGIWILGASDLTVAAGILQKIEKPAFFVPWTSVDWIAVQSTF
jgi:hypothetical protein